MARLNLAVALRKVGSDEEALSELLNVKLDDGAGVSQGTVEYLKGMCLLQLGRAREAEQAFRAASASPRATLTDDGQLVKELAELELKKLRR